MALEKNKLRTLVNCQLLANEGKFVLIHGEEIAGVFDTYHDALKIGYARLTSNRSLSSK